MFRDPLPPTYCALQFMVQWERYERALHERFIAGPDIGGLRQALRYFQVARNFPGIREDQNAEFVLQELEKSLKSASSTVARVTGLASTFKRRFGRNNVSAASKLLWLTERHPFIIYDGRAVKVLRDFGYDIPNLDYDAFFEAWISAYEAREKEIQKATEELAQAHQFLPCSYPLDRQMLRAPWFKERVFDLYLWEFGGSLST